MAGTLQMGCTFTGPRDSAPPARCFRTAVGLAPERLILQGKGLPEAVINRVLVHLLLLPSRRRSGALSLIGVTETTLSNLKAKVGRVLAFLQYLLEKGLAFSTVFA